jgi:hypothetical protein
MPHDAMDVVKAIDQIRSNKDMVLYLDSARRWRNNNIYHNYPDTDNIWAAQEATEAMKAITTVGRGIQTLQANIFPKA